jgi:hypothetical protein
MAQVTGEANGGLLRVALGISAAFFAIIVAMLGYWISQQAEANEVSRNIAISNANRLTAIETRLGRMEGDIRDINGRP